MPHDFVASSVQWLARVVQWVGFEMDMADSISAPVRMWLWSKSLLFEVSICSSVKLTYGTALNKKCIKFVRM